MSSVDETIAERLAFMIHACGNMDSPFTAAFLRGALEDYGADPAVGEALNAHASALRIGLHLADAFHYLALAGDESLAAHYPSTGGDGDARAAWRAARAIIHERPAEVDALMRRIPQTNETARAMPLLGAYAFVAARFERPLRILELGASGGLNLRFDHFGYDGGNWQWGDLESPLVLRNRIESGRPRHLDADITVVERRGCDPHPLDVTREEDRLELQSFLWPDQPERFERLRRALAVAQHVPVRIDAEGLETWLPREGAPRDGVATVVTHTLVMEHLQPEAKAALGGIVRDCAAQTTAQAPYAYVRMELDELARTYRTAVATWPGDGASTTICTSNGHAQEIVWSGA